MSLKNDIELAKIGRHQLYIQALQVAFGGCASCGVAI